MRAATLALVVRHSEKDPALLETLCDDREILVLENAILSGEGSPLDKVYEHREQQSKEENEFADYVEELLSQPFLKSDVQEHGVQWLKSKMRIEQYQQSEIQAAKVIAEYAFQVFLHEQDRTDFLLAGPNAQVRIRVFVLPASPASRRAA